METTRLLAKPTAIDIDAPHAAHMLLSSTREVTEGSGSIDLTPFSMMKLSSRVKREIHTTTIDAIHSVEHIHGVTQSHALNTKESNDA